MQILMLLMKKCIASRNISLYFSQIEIVVFIYLSLTNQRKVLFLFFYFINNFLCVIESQIQFNILCIVHRYTHYYQWKWFINFSTITIWYLISRKWQSIVVITYKFILIILIFLFWQSDCFIPTDNKTSFLHKLHDG